MTNQVPQSASGLPVNRQPPVQPDTQPDTPAQGTVQALAQAAPSGITAGWLQGLPSAQVRHVPSPNYNARPHLQAVRLIVLHNISLPPAQFGGGFIEQFFLNQLDSQLHPYFQSIANTQVSAHLLILRTGEVIQFVSFDHRAWHAGRSSYLGVPECNDYSVGIELEGCDDQPFSEAQYAALVDCIVAIYQAYPATRQHLAGHSDIAPGRKTDPGAYLDWMRIRQQVAARRNAATLHVPPHLVE